MLSVGQLANLLRETHGSHCDSELAGACFSLFSSVRLLNYKKAFSLNYGCESNFFENYKNFLNRPYIFVYVCIYIMCPVT